MHLNRISLEDSDWQWSKPFSVWNEGTQMIHFNSEKNFTIFMTVKNVSKTQKQITFFGQLIVCNMLAEHFEMKVVEVVSDNKEQEFRVAQSHIVGGRSAAPSIFINNKKNYILRLRFYGLESSWTGDIPLREHATGKNKTKLIFTPVVKCLKYRFSTMVGESPIARTRSIPISVVPNHNTGFC